MNELLAALSRIERLKAVETNYEKSLELLAALKAGSVSIDDVRLVEGGWQIGAPAEPLKIVPESAESA